MLLTIKKYKKNLTIVTYGLTLFVKITETALGLLMLIYILKNNLFKNYRIYI